MIAISNKTRSGCDSKLADGELSFSELSFFELFSFLNKQTSMFCVYDSKKYDFYKNYMIRNIENDALNKGQ